MRKKVSERKERSDKKVDIKPTIPIHLYNCIADFSDISNQPIMNIVEFLCMKGIESKKVIEFISQYFLRDYWHGDTLYRGNPSLNHNRYIKKKERCQRISTRFTKEFFEKLEYLAFVLGLTPSSTTCLLLDYSIKDITIIDKFIRTYTTELSEYQKDTLESALKYLNRNNPYREQITFWEVVKMLIDEVIVWRKNL